LRDLAKNLRIWAIFGPVCVFEANSAYGEIFDLRFWAKNLREWAILKE